jgi:hypothetical protein
MVHFREVQQFRQSWLWAPLLGVMASLCYGLYRQFWLRQPFGDHPMSDVTLLLISSLFFFLIAWFYLVKLVTEVHDQEIRARFNFIWFAKRIPFNEIRSVEAVTYRPLRDYGGWGIRLGREGWAYNVSGNRGVRFHYKDGKKFLIGSQRPEELEQAIQARMSAAK